jgi:hypothetical protein
VHHHSEAQAGGAAREVYGSAIYQQPSVLKSARNIFANVQDVLSAMKESAGSYNVKAYHAALGVATAVADAFGMHVAGRGTRGEGVGGRRAAAGGGAVCGWPALADALLGRRVQVLPAPLRACARAGQYSRALLAALMPDSTNWRTWGFGACAAVLHD